MIKRIKQALRRFIIKTVIDNYMDNGEVRQIVADGGRFEHTVNQVPPPIPTLGQVPMSDYR